MAVTQETIQAVATPDLASSLADMILRLDYRVVQALIVAIWDNSRNCHSTV